MAEGVLGTPDLKDMGEEELWDLINDNRHAICLGVRTDILIPYLRQVRVLTDLDEDEILTCLKFTNRCMRTSHMLDLLRIQGRNGAVALLDSLMIHYQSLYTHVTGRKPSIEPSGFSGLIKYSELTEYLVRAVTSMQKELHEAREEATLQRTRCHSLEGTLSKAQQQGQEQTQLQAEHAQMRNQCAGLHRDLMRLKDEKCDLYVRYAAAVEEKAAATIRCRELNLQVYQLQCELRKAQSETEFQRQCSLKNASPCETQHLRDEVCTLRRQLLEAEKISPAHQDILAQDLEEARDRRSELAEQLRRLHEENEALTRERDELLEEKALLALQVQKFTLDCEMYQQKCTVFQSQLDDLQTERDRAYLARDEAQAQIACSLAEKDTLRGQLVELQEKVFNLRTQNIHTPNITTERQFSWQSSTASSEGTLFSPPARPRLRRLNALAPGSSYEAARQSSEDGSSSRRSSMVEPPCAESLRRREIDPQFDDHRQEVGDDSSFCLLDVESDFVFVPQAEDEAKSLSSPRYMAEFNGVLRGSAPPFLMRSRPQALRITGRAMTFSFQGEALLSQLEVIGGNKTGVFVHQVFKGSAASNAGISPGAQILEVKCELEQRALRMVLEDSTLEEALWALGQVRGTCSLSVRPKQDAYDNLRQQMKSGEVRSGDSFYVRVNMSLPGGGPEALTVTCNDILHVTDTHHGNGSSWWASHVHSCQLTDLESGTLPNYYRAQRQLIRAIEDLSFQQRCPKERSQGKQKTVRIVSTGRRGRNPLWVSLEEDDNSQDVKASGDCNTPKCCMTLMPYTLVTPHYPPVCRPVLLLPTILGHILHKRLAEQEGYQLCEPESLSVAEHAAQMQKGGVLEECELNTHRCYTVQGVEKIMKRGTHCVLPLGLDCVRRLHRAEIFPIIIFVATTERTTRRIKNKLRQSDVTEAQLLECSRSEEPLLDKLPCLYRTIPPDAWSDSATLVDTLKYQVEEEQRMIVWVEPDLW